MTVRKRDKMWEVSIFLPGSRRDSNRRFRRRYESGEKANAIDHKIQAAIWAEKTGQSGALQKALEEIAGSVWSQSTRVEELVDRYNQEYVVICNRELKTKACRLARLKKAFGKRPVDTLSPSDVSRYIGTRRKEGVTNATINREVSILKHMLAWAKDLQVIQEHPLLGVKKLDEPIPEPRENLEADIAATFAFLPAGWRPLFTFLYETGCRKGEALGLRYDQLYLEEQVAVLPKTKSGRPRYLALTPRAIEAIRSMVALDDRVFPWRDCRYPWNKARERAGLKWLKIKDIRTAFAMRIADLGGIEKHTIQTLLGHSSVRTTERFYAFHDQKLAIQRYLERFKSEVVM